MGTGLGLSQAYGLAQQSHGDLAINSVLGQGTEVTLYFPALPGDAPGMTATAPVFPETALVVDDQDDVREMAATLFNAIGYEVISAANGAAALDELKRNPNIEVLFSDVVMPAMSGFTLAREARLLRPALKIILASGYAAEALDDGGSVADEFAFIAKPYTLAQILKHLRAAR